MAARILLARVAQLPLSVDRVLDLVRDPGVGGIAVFVGVVRDRDQGHDVSSLDYTAHPLADDALRRCAEAVAARHEVSTVAVEHRSGHLEIGDLAVVVAVGAVHRGAALAACTELIDQIKAEVPIWKEQRYATGATSWVGL